MRHSLLICLLLAAPAHAAEWSAQLQPMFETHCIDCHDAETKKGDLDLTALSWKPDDAANFQLWVKLHDKVQGGEMPPKTKSGLKLPSWHPSSKPCMSRCSSTLRQRQPVKAASWPAG
jgi:hypothetical protein